MPRRSGKIYRDIGLLPEHNKWLEEQAGGDRGVSKIVQQCIQRTIKHTDAATRIDLLQKELNEIKEAFVKTSDRIDTIAAFLEFQVWIATNRNGMAFDRWHEEFSTWKKETENA